MDSAPVGRNFSAIVLTGIKGEGGGLFLKVFRWVMC